MQRIVYLKIVSLLIFVGLLYTGFSLACYKPLWIDEVFSQKGLQDYSYIDLLRGRMQEGNNSPLFYIIQKIVCDLAGYRLPNADYDTQIWDERARILLRMSPIAAMALAMTFIFYFFARYYGIWAGLYGLLTVFFSYNVWLYWAEARPYALWFFLTTMQSMIFINIIRQKILDQGSWRWLIFVNFLLSLTTIFSVFQTLAVSLLLWILKEKNWRKYIWLTVVPVLICIPYYWMATKAKFYFPTSFTQLIYPCFPKEWMFFLLFYVLFLVFCYTGDKRGSKVFNKSLLNPGGIIQPAVLAYLAFTLLMFLAAALVLVIFKVNAITLAQGGFEISHRYFIYLTPVGVIAVTAAAVHFAEAFKGHPWRLLNVMIVLWGFLVIGILRNCVWAVWFF